MSGYLKNVLGYNLFLLSGKNVVNEMLGAIIGDIVGSVYELNYI